MECFLIFLLTVVIVVLGDREADSRNQDIIEQPIGKYFDAKVDHRFSDVNIPALLPNVNTIRADNKLRSVRALVNEKVLKWPNGVVPYEFDPATSDFRDDEKLSIQTAMASISEATKQCIRFVERTEDMVDYLMIIRSIGCYSYVGRKGGRQEISFTRGCLEDLVNGQHTLMHALGFFHEHSRADRDEYVTIFWDNIKSCEWVFRMLSGYVDDGPEWMKIEDKHSSITAYVENFKKQAEMDTLSLPYDYQSVLHSSAFDFATNRSLPTILPKQKGVLIGHKDNLSDLDILRLKKAYHCSEGEPRKPREDENGEQLFLAT